MNPALRGSFSCVDLFRRFQVADAIPAAFVLRPLIIAPWPRGVEKTIRTKRNWANCEGVREKLLLDSARNERESEA